MEGQVSDVPVEPPVDNVALPAAAAVEPGAAVREDQVQSAVGFLSHPKVRLFCLPC